MKVFAIGDLHLSTKVKKPMDIFGPGWDNHFERITQDWNERVSDEDLVLIPGDISWAMYQEEAIADLDLIGALKGVKVMIRGNHDYWWKSISAVRSVLKPNFFAIQNDCLRFGKVLVCGTRGWTVPDGGFKTEEDEKIYKREVIRFELSLNAMEKMRKDGDKVVAMLHYPPFNAKLMPSDFTQLAENFNIDALVYGHLHGRNCRACKDYTHNRVQYLLTSCDQVDCKLVEVMEVD